MTKLGTAFVDVEGDFTSLNKQLDAALSGVGGKFGKFLEITAWEASRPNRRGRVA